MRERLKICARPTPDTRAELRRSPHTQQSCVWSWRGYARHACPVPGVAPLAQLTVGTLR